MVNRKRQHALTPRESCTLRLGCSARRWFGVDLNARKNNVRVDLLRKGRTYELLITSHELCPANNGNRPQFQSEVLFHGVHGRLELDLCGRDKSQAGRVAPSFLSLAGELVPIPEKFVPAVWAATKGVNCAGCVHSHYLRRLATGDLSKPEETSPRRYLSRAKIN